MRVMADRPDHASKVNSLAAQALHLRCVSLPVGLATTST